MAAGCTHFIIGRDMAGCKSTLTGEDFYGAYDAQDNAKAHAKELGMDTVPSLNITYTEVSAHGCRLSKAVSRISCNAIACAANSHLQMML